VGRGDVRRIVALKPTPAFKALFQIATTKEGSGVILYNEKTLALSESSDDLCSWWRRERVDIAPSILAMGLYPLFLTKRCKVTLAAKAGKR
jgi:hypothetical protein